MALTNVHPRSALAAGTNATDLRDIKPPIEIPSGWAWVGWVLLVLAVAALAFWAWRYWQKQRAQAQVVPVVPPHVRAKQKLREALAMINQPREFCILVSDTIRAYLEERFEFRAPERTTEEFLYELQGTNLLLPDQKNSLGEFLKRCDLVKFAKYEPGRPELEDLHASALRLVEETEPVMAALEAVKAQGVADGGVIGETHIANSPIAASTALPAVSQQVTSKGKRFAIIGIVLQLAPCVPVLAYFTVILGFISHALGTNDPAQGTAAAEALLGHMIGVAILLAICLVAALAGLTLLVIALTKLRYRAEWFFWFLMVYSVILLGVFPFGTAAAVFFFVYCLTRRQEFLRRRAATSKS
jgi:hypothetical protein